VPVRPRESGPFEGSVESAELSYWNQGGCGEFAIALQREFPILGLEGVRPEALDGGIGHVWAADSEGRYFDVFGSRSDRPYPGHPIATDLTAEEIAEGLGLAISEAAVAEAQEIVRRMFGRGS